MEINTPAWGCATGETNGKKRVKVKAKQLCCHYTVSTLNYLSIMYMVIMIMCLGCFLVFVFFNQKTAASKIVIMPFRSTSTEINHLCKRSRLPPPRPQYTMPRQKNCKQCRGTIKNREQEFSGLWVSGNNPSMKSLFFLGNPQQAKCRQRWAQVYLPPRDTPTRLAGIKSSNIHLSFMTHWKMLFWA